MASGHEADVDIRLEDYDRWLCRMAIRAGASRQAVTDSDQYGAALLGFMKAKVRFDPTRGVKFITHLKWWVFNEIGRLLHRERGYAGSVKRGTTVTLFSQMDGFDPSVDLTFEEDVCESDLIGELLSCLDERSRRMVERYYLEERTLEEVGQMEVPTLTRARVSQIVIKAIAKVQKVHGIEV